MTLLFAALLAAAAPYPPSPVVARMTWDAEIVRIGTNTGDNWPAAWGADNSLYTSYGDGGGFNDRKPKLTLGFARITGTPPAVRAEEIQSGLDTPVGWGKKGIKSSGMLIVDGVLYMFVRKFIVDGDYTNARLAWSKDLGKTWTWAPWHVADTFGCPAKDRIADRGAWEFFAGEGKWSADIARRKPIFTDPLGAQRVSITYNRALKRYFLTTSIGTDGKDTKLLHTGGLGVFDAPEPWGPWTTAFYDLYWSGGHGKEYALPEWTYHHKFPPKYMSEDGSAMWLLFSGRGNNYTYCLQKATLEVKKR